MYFYEANKKTDIGMVVKNGKSSQGFALEVTLLFTA